MGGAPTYYKEERELRRQQLTLVRLGKLYRTDTCTKKFIPGRNLEDELL